MANMLGPIDTPHQFVFVPDVGPVVNRLMRADGAWGHVWHFAGSGVVTQRDLAERVRQSRVVKEMRFVTTLRSAPGHASQLLGRIFGRQNQPIAGKNGEVFRHVVSALF